MNSNIIIVNATSLRSGGALTILKQFLNNIPDDGFVYLVFVDKSVVVEKERTNVRIISVDKRRWISRFLWDSFKLNKYLKQNKIYPFSSISLQNTNFRIRPKCHNYIYYHQSLPLIPYKWNFLDSSERLFWLYRHVYPFFVKLFVNKKTVFFVQINFIKGLFAKKYKIDEKRIHVVSPDLEIMNPIAIEHLAVNPKSLNLFYPAMPLKYKNHNLLFNSLASIDKVTTKNITLYLTCDRSDFDVIPNYQHVRVEFIGQITHNQVFWLMERVDALVFPSCIETLGLPLLEAASIGLPVLVADLQYAREALDDYAGAIFIVENLQAWENGILDLFKNPIKRYTPLLKKNTNSWGKLFEILKQ